MPTATPLLDTVRVPADLRKLKPQQLRQVADELRAETIDAVSVTGGHLGAGLGVVELATVFDNLKPDIVVSIADRFETMATQSEVHVDICSVCHPFYTGKQRLVDTAGRVDRFKKKYEKSSK